VPDTHKDLQGSGQPILRQQLPRQLLQRRRPVVLPLEALAEEAADVVGVVGALLRP